MSINKLRAGYEIKGKNGKNQEKGKDKNTGTSLKKIEKIKKYTFEAKKLKKIGQKRETDQIVPKSKEYNIRQENRVTLIKLLSIYSANLKTGKGKLLNWKLYM